MRRRQVGSGRAPLFASHGKSSVLLAAVAIPLLLAALAPLSRQIEELMEQIEPGADVLNISSARVLKKLSLGYDPLLANIYWTRVVQYYGSKRHEHNAYMPLLEPLLEITVTLDPQLLVAYKAGAMFLAEPAPKGAGRPDLAAALLRKGIVANPDDWRLWNDLGLIYYWDLKDYQRAAQAYLEGSKHPQAREWMKVMAARIAQEGRTPETSRFLWRQIVESTQDPNIRRNAEEHLMGLKAEEDAEHLEALLNRYHFSSLQELVAARILPGIPVDPAGFPYRRMPDGRIGLDPRSPVNSPNLPKH